MTICEFIYTKVFHLTFLRWALNQAILALLPVSVRLGRAEIFLNPRDPVVSGALAFGVYEKDEIQHFSQTIQPGMTVVDVGANLGAYSAVALDRLSGQGQLLAVEPSKDNFLWLQRNLKLNRALALKTKVHAVRVALSNKTEAAVLHKNPTNKGDNRLYPHSLLSGAEKVWVTTLDELCAKKKIQSIDVLKIDVQGFEARVLAGAGKILMNSPRLHLFFEFWAEGMLSADSNPALLIQNLEKHNFKIYQVSSKGMRRIEPSRLIAATQGRNYLNIYAFRGS